MEVISSEQRKMEHQQQQPPPTRTKGGLVTMPSIIANEALEKVASLGLTPNMIMYLMNDYKMGVAQGTNFLFYFNASGNFMPIIGAFLSDSYLGRFLTIGLGSIFSSMGMLFIWLTAMLPRLRPPPCNQLAEKCKSATPGQFAFLVSGFALMSIGAGGIRPCSLAFGADQLDDRNNPKNESVLERFFGWYYAATAIAVMIALTVIVYIQDHFGWKIGFGVPAIVMFSAALVFFLASPFYIKLKANKSLFMGFIQVPVVAYKNRKLAFPPQNSLGGYHRKKDSILVVPTNKLRFLNKACIIRNPEDISHEGEALNSWNLSTVDQVEEIKALLKVLPLWSTGIMLAINMSQTSFPFLQAKSMDRHVTSGFQIPAGSFGMFTIGAIVIWVILYDRAILPLASKIRGKPTHLSAKQRMGIGLVFTCLSMVVSGLVEHVRRRRAIEEGFINNPSAVIAMSAYWLVPQHCLSGLAEAFNAIGQSEFYYSEFPKSMSSLASVMFGLGMAVANLLASIIVNTVDHLTKRGGKESWVSNNINKGRYEYYYWLLAVMSFFNLFYFLLCSWAYGPGSERGMFKVGDEGKELEEEELSKQGNGVKDEGEDSKEGVKEMTKLKQMTA